MVDIEVNPFNDPYYNKEYISLYLNEGDEIIEFSYSENGKIFYNVGIKRRITSISNVLIDDPYYDVETVYGYGGFYTNTHDNSFLDKAVKLYKEFCIENRIVAEFIRFNPLNPYIGHLSNYLDFFEHNRDVVVVDLNLKEEEIMKNYSSRTRDYIRRLLKDNSYKTEILESEDSKNKMVEKFYDLYYQTMQKNKAEKFYYFDKYYFKGLNKLSFSKLFVVYKDDEIISMAYFLEGDKVAYYHLSANDPLKYSLRGNYLALHEAINYYASMKKKYLILGGGRSKRPDDGLFVFKRKFSKKTLPFYIGGKIYIEDKYKEFCNLSRSNESKFLKYRA